MSWQEAVEPKCRGRQGQVKLVIVPGEKDLGGFSVRRVLPAAERQMVGPFIFFDHLGPARFPPGAGIDVRPHPHIGLSTVTFLFEGEIVHRDSLGYVQPIQPGAVNLMTAGRGIVHSERTDPRLRPEGPRVHGIQSWMALPDGKQEIEPAFVHHPAESLPSKEVEGARLRLILGEAFGMISPVEVHTPTLYLEARLATGAELALPEASELAAYVVAGSATVGDCALAAGSMGIVDGPCGAVLRASSDSHVMVIGGDPVGERHLWWNFVASSLERIEQGKRDWAGGAFDAVPVETEFIPLPPG